MAAEVGNTDARGSLDHEGKGIKVHERNVILEDWRGGGWELAGYSAAIILG